MQNLAFTYPVADPGFPVGGHGPVRGACGPIGGIDPRCGLFSAKMYAKTKELGPVGGMHPARRPPLDPPMLPIHA